jgi:ABC-type amino acid transport system permease subunit
MPAGQYEAAKLLGYNRRQTFVIIILPQVVKSAFCRAVTNEVITLVKDTSLAFTISVAEMFSTAKAHGKRADQHDAVCGGCIVLLHLSISWSPGEWILRKRKCPITDRNENKPGVVIWHCWK